MVQVASTGITFVTFAFLKLDCGVLEGLDRRGHQAVVIVATAQSSEVLRQLLFFRP
jgi:hypothetical protein